MGKGRELSPEDKLAINNALQGRELSPEHKLAISNTVQGREISQEHKLAISNANKGCELLPAHRLAQSKASAKYHFRVTKLDTKEILLEDYTRKEVGDSKFAANYYQTNGFSLVNHLKARFQGANITGSIILNVSGVNYRIEKYLRNK